VELKPALFNDNALLDHSETGNINKNITDEIVYEYSHSQADIHPITVNNVTFNIQEILPF
jgi:hypothetical protein